MPTLTQSNPKYRKHRASGQAVVTLSGVDHYLGPHGTKASQHEYDRLIALWLANGRSIPAPESDLTVVELLAAFRRWAVGHYRKNGRQTRSLGNVDDALKPLRLLYGRELVREFGPLKLQAIQRILIAGYSDAKGKPVKPASRGVINKRIGIIKQAFRWAVSQEMAPPGLAHALECVRGLQAGRTDAREPEPVGPVGDATVAATLAHLPPVVADMVRVQRLTGCRPGEVCGMRPTDLDLSGEIWVYRPATHKTEHHGRQRTIFIGPQAQGILKPYLVDRRPDACLFTPKDSEQRRHRTMRANRQTPVQPSQQQRRKRNPKRTPTDAYDKNSFRTAIARACTKAGVDTWAPNRLRHTAATEIRKKFGLEAAQVVLGHSAAHVTQIYAERDATLGCEAMRQIG